jgi:hypothetical protein
MGLNLKAAIITSLILFVIFGFIYSLLFYTSIMVPIGMCISGVIMVVSIFNIVKLTLQK